jgi:hypothetical protein
MSSTGLPTSKATCELLDATHQILKSKALVVADKEHFTKEIINHANKHHDFDILIPALNIPRIKKIYPSLSYKRKWAGFAIAETRYNFENDQEEYRLIVQRIGEKQDEYEYKSFLTTSKKEARTLICENYDKRWSVEEFFRFENELGISRASTFNLNIRYGKLALALMAQAATYQLRKKMNEDYQKWDAKHLANEILASSDGDIRAKGDTIIVTFYGAPKHINSSDYVNLPTKLSGEGVNPRIPWLFDYKLDFRFK